MTQQLRQAARIAGLRERRAKRVRLEAKEVEAQRAFEAQKAHDHYQEEKARRESAEFMLLDNPADPQALLWRGVTEEKCDVARGDRADAYERLKEARTNLAEKRVIHERSIERGNIIGSQLQVSLRTEALRREALADEEAQEQKM